MTLTLSRVHHHNLQGQIEVTQSILQALVSSVSAPPFRTSSHFRSRHQHCCSQEDHVKKPFNECERPQRQDFSISDASFASYCSKVRADILDGAYAVNVTDRSTFWQILLPSTRLTLHWLPNFGVSL